MHINRYFHPVLVIPLSLSPEEIQEMQADYENPKLVDQGMVEYLKRLDEFIINNIIACGVEKGSRL